MNRAAYNAARRAVRQYARQIAREDYSRSDCAGYLRNQDRAGLLYVEQQVPRARVDVTEDQFNARMRNRRHCVRDLIYLRQLNTRNNGSHVCTDYYTRELRSALNVWRAANIGAAARKPLP